MRFDKVFLWRIRDSNPWPFDCQSICKYFVKFYWRSIEKYC